eukprot:11159326-Lingulodinium_polyedra.AAC.1
MIGAAPVGSAGGHRTRHCSGPRLAVVRAWTAQAQSPALPHRRRRHGAGRPRRPAQAARRRWGSRRKFLRRVGRAARRG